MSQMFEELHGDGSDVSIREGLSAEPFCTVYDEEVFCNALCKVKCKPIEKYIVIQETFNGLATDTVSDEYDPILNMGYYCPRGQ